MKNIKVIKQYILNTYYKKTVVLFLFLSNSTFAQTITSGQYNTALTLAYNTNTNQITGFFENSTGWDEKTNQPRFSCMFYLKGTVHNNHADIITYYPDEELSDTIHGTIDIINAQKINIKLANDHGGCWNVEQFSIKPLEYSLEKPLNLIQINYVTTKKTYFYSQKTNRAKQSSYIIKNDIVYVDTLDSEWAHCTYYGAKTKTGWIKLADLNKL